jgi:drug/metabolite transporter (DMT)-like permease
VPTLTIVFGALLIGLGVGGYFMTGQQSITALIPAFAGALFLILGVIAQKPGARKHAMHAAAALAVLGFLGTVPGLIKFFRMLAGEEMARPAAVRSQAIMAVLCVVFVILCVRSFIAARRARQGGFDVTPPTA